jgi:hypothetical protein
MKALTEHINKLDKVERDIKNTRSKKRKNDLIKYRNRLKRELREYVRYRGL